MSKQLTVAIGSTCSIPGDVHGNLDQIAAMARRAAANQCDLLLTPELSASGYGGYPEVLATAEQAGEGRIFSALADIADSNQLTVLAGFVERSDERKFLSQYVVRPAGEFVVQRKHRVTPLESPLDPAVALEYDDTEEIGHVPPGAENINVFEVAGVRCAIVICADLGIRGLNDLLAAAKVQLLLLPTAAGGKRLGTVTTSELSRPSGIERYVALAGASFFPEQALRDCIRYDRAFAAVNMCGFDGRSLYHGGSGCVVDPSGSIEAMIAGSANLDRQVPRFAAGTVSFRSAKHLETQPR